MVIQFHRRLILPAGSHHIGLDSIALGEETNISREARNQNGGLRQRESTLRVDAKFLLSGRIQLQNQFVAQEIVLAEKGFALVIVGQRRQCGKQSGGKTRGWCLAAHENPSSSSRSRRLSRHFWRRSPIEPVAKPRLSAACW